MKVDCYWFALEDPSCHQKFIYDTKRLQSNLQAACYGAGDAKQIGL